MNRLTTGSLLSRMPAEVRDAREGFIRRNLRWNFSWLMVDTTFFIFGVTFFDGATVLPLLIRYLGGSDEVVGLAQAIRILGWTLPALFAAHYIHGRALHKWFLVIACVFARAGIITLGPMLLFVAPQNPKLALVWFFIVYGIFWFVDGGAAVSWFDIVAKVIPPRIRGTFFGAMQSLGGLVSIGVGLILAFIMDERRFVPPENFAILGGLWAIGIWISLGGIVFIREAKGDAIHVDDKPGIGEYLKSILPLMRHNAGLRRLILSRFLLEGGGMAVSFYILFALKDLKQLEAIVASYVAAKAIGKVLTGPVWAWVSDKIGPVVGYRWAATAVALIPVVALVTNKEYAWILVIAFFLQGSVEDGLWSCYTNALFGTVTERDRPLAVGVSSVCQSPTFVYGILGGFLASHLGYRPLFVIAAAVAFTGLMFAYSVPKAKTATA